MESPSCHSINFVVVLGFHFEISSDSASPSCCAWPARALSGWSQRDGDVGVLAGTRTAGPPTLTHTLLTLVS